MYHIFSLKAFKTLHLFLKKEFCLSSDLLEVLFSVKLLVLSIGSVVLINEFNLVFYFIEILYWCFRVNRVS